MIQLSIPKEWSYTEQWRTAHMKRGFLKEVQKAETAFLCCDQSRIHGGGLCPLVHGTYQGQNLKLLNYRRKFNFKSWYIPYYKISLFSWTLMEAAYSKCSFRCSLMVVCSSKGKKRSVHCQNYVGDTDLNPALQEPAPDWNMTTYRAPVYH